MTERYDPMLNGFAITTEPEPDGVGVCVIGELDISTAPQLSDVLTELANDGHRHVFLDLGGVEFIDSSGVSAIIRASRTADQNGHQLAVRSVSSQVRRVFNLVGLMELLTLD